MKTYTIIIKGEKMNITSVNSTEVNNEDALWNGQSNNHFENKEDVKSFVDGNDYVEAYYTKQTANEEFESFMNLDTATKIDETTIEITEF